MARMAQDVDLSSGILRGATGPMAKVSWGDLPIITYNSGSGFQGPNRSEMQDGGVGSYTLSAGAAGHSNGATMRTVVRCSGIGIRVRCGSASQQPPVDMIVDGRCVEAFRSTQPIVDGIANGSWVDPEQTFEWPYALKRTRHTASIRIDANPDGTTVNVLPISGWLLPRADGFRDSSPAPRKSFLSSRQALTTTAALLPVGYDMATLALHLDNTDTSAHVVTIYREDGTTIFDTISVPAAAGAGLPGVATYRFTAPRNLTGWKFKADAGAFLTIAMENM